MGFVNFPDQEQAEAINFQCAKNRGSVHKKVKYKSLSTTNTGIVALSDEARTGKIAGPSVQVE